VRAVPFHRRQLLRPGIGHRRDGWPNRDLNVGAIIALSPAVTAEQKAVYNSWGPGKYDPRFNLDGKSTPLVLPPAYGLAHVKNETYTAEGPISYWNAYVAVTQMHGQGNFSDPRLNLSVRQSPDLVTSKLAALREYQHSLSAPPPGAADAAVHTEGAWYSINRVSPAMSGRRGRTTTGQTSCIRRPKRETDGAYAMRTASKAYRTTPLRGLIQHAPYFHDGSAATLDAVWSIITTNSGN
jgi:hypothetical protein